MTIEAFRIGVTISLVNRVSDALRLIGRDFVKVDGSAKSLQKSLDKIRLLGLEPGERFDLTTDLTIAFSVIFGEIEGGKFDWDQMRWAKQTN